MTVISVKPQSGGLSGAAQLPGIRNYTKVYVVVTDSDSDGVVAVGNSLGLPAMGSVYSWQGETDLGALLWSKEPRQDKNDPRVWIVTCQYTSDLAGGGSARRLGGDPRYDVDNPLAAPMEVTWGSWEETVIATHDRRGPVIVNAANCPPNPALTKNVKHRRVTVVRNEATYPVILDQQYSGTVNSDPFYGWAPWTAKLEGLTAVSQFAQGTLYWRVRYDIMFKKPDWKVRILNTGNQFFKKDANGAKILNADGTSKLFVTEDDGVPSTNLVLLSVLGYRLSPEDVAAGLANTLTIELDEPKPFSALNL